MPTLKRGDIVRHEQFGLGVVTEDPHAGEVPVDFDGEMLLFSVAAAPLVRVSDGEERERRRDTFRQEQEGEDQHFPGSHWEPFYRNVSDAAANVQAVVDANMVDRFSSDCLSPRASITAGVEWPHDPVYFTGPTSDLSMRVVVQVNAAGEPHLMSFFPLCRPRHAAHDHG